MIENKEQALSTALEFYKGLAMHDWLPYIYRLGGGRVLVMDTGAIKDIFHNLTNSEIFDASKMTALKRKIINPLFKGVDLSNPEHWQLVLNELENMGWGKFTRIDNEIMVEFCEIPTPYLLGYFEVMFKTKFTIHPVKMPDITLLIGEKIQELEI